MQSDESVAAALASTRLSKRAQERSEWEESSYSSQAAVRAQKQLSMDLVLAKKALLMVRREELKALFAHDAEAYQAELKARGLVIRKDRL